MELNLSSYQKLKLKKAWFYDTGEKIKLNSKHVKKTNTDYYALFPSLSIRNKVLQIKYLKKWKIMKV